MPGSVGHVVMVNIGTDRVYRPVGAVWMEADPEEFTDYSGSHAMPAVLFWHKVVDRDGGAISERAKDALLLADGQPVLKFEVLVDGMLVVSGFRPGLSFSAFVQCFPVEILEGAPCDLRLCLTNQSIKLETPRGQ